MTVFGLTMGQPFNVPECKKELKKSGSIRYYAYYTSPDSITCDCFQKRNIYYYKTKKKEPIPEEKQLNKNDTVYVYFQPTNTPKITFERFTAAIGNSNLIEVVFHTPSDADYVLNELTQKYGNNHSLKYYQWQNGLGGAQNYYIARWEFSDLLIIYQSSIAYNSNAGEVTIRWIDSNQPKASKGRGL
jgi:hypothetical protein